MCCLSVAIGNSSGSLSLPLLLWKARPLHPHLLKPSGKIFLGYNLPILVETKCFEIWRFYADYLMSCSAGPYLMIYYLIYINDNKWSQLLALKSEEIAAHSML